MVAAAAVLAGCGGGGGSIVRATFLDAHGVAPGTTVRIDGRDAGVVDAVDLDRRARAVVALRLPERTAARFRRDATCVLTEATVGDRVVACRPTTTADGDVAPAPLAARRHGGTFVRTLPVDRTAAVVDAALLDAVRDHDPDRRLGIVVRDLGVGMADAGPDLRRALRAAIPGLRDADSTLDALADATADLDRTAARARGGLRSLAAERDRIGRSLRRGAALQQAVAARAPEIGRTLRA
ncbi:MAG: MlaD family protein, partial [Solirubrobacteraceae bacterium]